MPGLAKALDREHLNREAELLIDCAWRRRPLPRGKPHAPHLRRTVGMVTRKCRQTPGIQDTGVNVALERKQNSPPPDELVSFDTDARMPEVAGEFVVRSPHELLTLAWVLTHEH